MKWNNGRKWAEFEKKQAKLKKEYLAEGMTEDQIKKIYEYDLSVYRKERREAMHTQKLNFDSDEFDDKETDNPLLEKFLKAISFTPESTDTSRFGWIEEVEDDKLAKALKSLPRDYLDILTDVLINGYSQMEIAIKRAVTNKAINKKIRKIKKFLKNF